MDARITATLADGYTIMRDAGTLTHQPVQHVLCLSGVRMGRVVHGAAHRRVHDRRAAVRARSAAAAVARHDGVDEYERPGIVDGAWDRDTDFAGGTWIGGVDAASPSVFRRATSAGLVLERARTPAPGPRCWQATVEDSDDASVTLGFSAVSGSADAKRSCAWRSRGRRRFVGRSSRANRPPCGASRGRRRSGLDGAVNEHTEAGKLKVFWPGLSRRPKKMVQVGDVSGATATVLIGHGATAALEAVTVGDGLTLSGNVLISTAPPAMTRRLVTGIWLAADLILRRWRVCHRAGAVKGTALGWACRHFSMALGLPCFELLAATALRKVSSFPAQQRESH